MLSVEDLSRLVAEKLKVGDKHSRTPTASQVAQELSDIYKKLNLPQSSAITFDQLNDGIGNLIIRGTSPMFRSRIVLQKFDKFLYPATVSLAKEDSKTGRCSNCTRKKYHLACHSYTLDKKGQLTEPALIKNESTSKQSKLARKESADYFGKDNKMNNCLDVFREYAENQGILTGIVAKKAGNYLKAKVSIRLWVLTLTSFIFTRIST